jgi:hypothetical protein
MEKAYGVYLTVPFEHVREWEEINEIAKSVNPNSCGSGTAIGGNPRYRDIDWVVTDLNAAELLERKLASAFALYEGTTIDIHSITPKEVE